MRTNILRHVAVALGLTVCTVAQAGEYNAPAKWSNFNANKTQSETQPKSVFKTVAGCLPCQNGSTVHQGGGMVIQDHMMHSGAGAVYQGGVVHQGSAGMYQGGVVHQGAGMGQHGVIQHGGVVGQGQGFVGQGAGIGGIGINGVGVGGIGQGGIGGIGQGGVIGGVAAGAAIGSGGGVDGSSTRGGISSGQAVGAGSTLNQGAAIGQGSVVGQGSGIVGQGSGIVGQGSGIVGQGSAIVGQGSAIVGQGSAIVGQGSIVGQGGLNSGTVINQGTVLNQGTIQGAPIYNQGIVQSPYASAVQAPWTGSAPVITQSIAAPQTYYSAPAASYGYSTGYATTQTRRGIGKKFRGARGCGISPYFGGFNLLFLRLNSNSNKNLLIDDATGNSLLGFNDVNPRDRFGFDVHAGRYLSNGLYGLDFGYFQFNPGVEERIVQTPGGTARATLPQLRDVNIDPGTGVDSVYNYYDNADAFRVRRDLRFQSIEANLVSFGWMGARRTGAACHQGLGRGAGFGSKLGLNSAGRYGGAGGALTRGGSRVQVATSHGFRWFQLEDSLEFAADVNLINGYQADDIFYNVDVENNLFGYQFGSRLTYSLTKRLLLNVGGKIGIYGNDVEYRQRLGTANALAYASAAGVDDIDTKESDTVFSALGELDLGLGYRFSNAWTLTGGYRMLSACGVATAPGQIAGEFSSLAASAAVHADDCIILHGGYFGLQYNW